MGAPAIVDSRVKIGTYRYITPISLHWANSAITLFLSRGLEAPGIVGLKLVPIDKITRTDLASLEMSFVHLLVTETPVKSVTMNLTISDLFQFGWLIIGKSTS